MFLFTKDYGEHVFRRLLIEHFYSTMHSFVSFQVRHFELCQHNMISMNSRRKCCNGKVARKGKHFPVFSLFTVKGLATWKKFIFFWLKFAKYLKYAYDTWVSENIKNWLWNNMYWFVILYSKYSLNNSTYFTYLMYFLCFANLKYSSS